MNCLHLAAKYPVMILARYLPFLFLVRGGIRIARTALFSSTKTSRMLLAGPLAPSCQPYHGGIQTVSAWNRVLSCLQSNSRSLRCGFLSAMLRFIE
ncbi:hypothetical protein SDJN03_13588, partial [Cucurbita argyrosperma subsp. sororia]